MADLFRQPIRLASQLVIHTYNKNDKSLPEGKLTPPEDNSSFCKHLRQKHPRSNK